MAQSDNIKRYLDAGVHFTQMTRERAEEIVKDLVKQGEVARKEAESRVEELLDRSRKQSEELVGIVRKEVARQLQALGLDDLAKRAKGGSSTKKPSSATTSSSGATTKTVKKATTTKAAAKKSPAKKATAKKSPAKKAAAKKSPAKKATAKKSPGTTSTASKSAAKKA